MAGNIFGDLLGPVGVGHALFVHAHPDDETLATGGVIAALVDSGARATVLTATRGERGDIVPGSLHDRPATDLVEVRKAELAGALAALGVTDHHWLGTPPARAGGRPPRVYQDSGMQWGATGQAEPVADVSAAALTSVPIGEEVQDLLALIDHDRPDLLVSYESTGGYGHPDHIRVHQIARAAAEAAGLLFLQVVPPGLAVDGDLAVDVAGSRSRLIDALRNYRTQLERVRPDHVVHVGGQRQDLPAVEYFRPVR
jgi:N-acetyl-1-D-myo-inositol-2-amino-2-deoxy-alpha-D-glucopyranoside deacetylase